MWWQPLIKTDLPRFVYSREVQNGGFTKINVTGLDKGAVAILRMETPVIYFYSQAERVVDVRVQFPKGIVTEWYPQAAMLAPYWTLTGNPPTPTAVTESMIEWKGVQILSRDAPGITVQQLIRDGAGADPRADHYYAARATNANFLRVSATENGAIEHERDLFYRGIGGVEAPLTVQTDASGSVLSLSTKSKEPLTSAFVLTIQRGKMRYHTVERIDAGVDVSVVMDSQPFAEASQARELVMQDVAMALERQGLYAKEARAMVDTWSDQWFAEEGTRVLYILPRSWTDETLPLQIRPQPDSIVRVMVGRAEVITPTAERHLKQQILTYLRGDRPAQEKAVRAARDIGLGRFLQPAAQLAIGKEPSEALWSAAMELSALASEPKVAEQSASAGHP